MSHHRMTQPTKVMLSDVCREGHEKSLLRHPTDRSNTYERPHWLQGGETFARSDLLHPRAFTGVADVVLGVIDTVVEAPLMNPSSSGGAPMNVGRGGAKAPP